MYPCGAATNTENKIITELQTLGYAVSVLFSVVRHKKAYITFKISWQYNLLISKQIPDKP